MIKLEGGLKSALKAIAKHTGVNIREAVSVTRVDGIFEEEIHIEDELIRLEEVIKNYHLAKDTVKDYPTMRKHLLHERRAILKHCIGLITRMMLGRPLPRPYTDQDTQMAMKQLVRLVVLDARLSGYELDREILNVLAPLMSLSQRRYFGVLSYNPFNYLKRQGYGV
jgi:hypothetical protein